MELLHAHGTPGQQRRFLEPLLRGEARSCFAMTEPEHAGSNPVHLSTRAVMDGGEYVIDGHKWFTSVDGRRRRRHRHGGHPARRGEAARARQPVPGPRGTPGFRIVRNIPVMGEAGEDYFSHAEVVFEGAAYPRRTASAREGAGFPLAQERLGPGRIHHCMRWIGICERRRDDVPRARSASCRRGQPLASRQAVQHWIAESRAEIDAARLMTLDTAERIDRGGRAGGAGAGVHHQVLRGGGARAGAGPRHPDHGALGITDDTLLSFWYRHERGARIYDGPDEVHNRWSRGRSCGSTEWVERLRSAVRACPRLAPGRASAP
jgi:alkylation response protein AidB-like acyl-CoA dehydrogenase